MAQERFNEAEKALGTYEDAINVIHPERGTRGPLNAPGRHGKRQPKQPARYQSGGALRDQQTQRGQAPSPKRGR